MQKYAKKTVEGEQVIISSLPSYDAEKDPHLVSQSETYFYNPEKKILRDVIKIVITQDKFYMMNKKGEPVYEIAYEAIDKIMHNEKGKPVYIYAVDKKSFRDRIPLPTWVAEFEQEIVDIIAARAGLEKQIELQEFRGARKYYGRQ